MEEIWSRIDSWLKVNALEVFDTLQPGASDSQIQVVEDALSVKLPDDFKASYRIHDGQRQPESWLGLIPDAQELFSLEYILGEWQMKKQGLNEGIYNTSESRLYPSQGIRSDVWNCKWIPFVDDGDGNLYCLDLDPAEAGTFGQIITWDNEVDVQKILAPSFRIWLEQYADKLESGEYIFSKKYSAFPGIITLELLQRFDSETI